MICALPTTLGKAERELVDDSLRAVSISLSYFASPDEVDAWLASRNLSTCPSYTKAWRISTSVRSAMPTPQRL